MEVGYLSKDPLVVLVSHWTYFCHAGFLEWFTRYRHGVKTLLLIVPWWALEHPKNGTDHDIAECALLRTGLAKGPLPAPKYISTIFLGNTRRQVLFARACGFESVFVNHNCMIDETKFAVVAKPDLVFDAVYNARLHPCKRHWLAKDIDSLGLIYTAPPHRNEEFFAYQDQIKTWLPKATYCNGPISRDPTLDKYCRFDIPKLSELYNWSGTGLCLSSVEGAMYVSTEYLLCGLPVVTTRNVGGRDVFLNSGNSIRCNDDSLEIAYAVKWLIKEQRDRYAIRNDAIQHMTTHRERLAAILRQFSDSLGIDTLMQVIRTSWHGFGFWWEIEKLGGYLS